MKNLLFLLLLLVSISCSQDDEQFILRTSSKTISIKDGDEFYKNIWTISPELELDEFIPQKTRGKKNVSFISDIDTITFNVVPNNLYHFKVQFNGKNAFTCINTDTLKAETIPKRTILEYYRNNKNEEVTTDTISFQLGEDNGIHLKGTVNNSDELDFLFDTGANAIVIASELIGKKVNVQLNGTTNNKGSDGIQTTSTSSGNKISIEGLNWDNVELLAIDYQQPDFDGVLGWTAFENKILEIDYEQNIIIIHDSMESVPKDYIKIETKIIDGVPYIKGVIEVNNKKTSGWFQYDSGSNGCFSLSQKFASEHNLNNAMEIVASSISTGSAGIEWKANDYILPKLSFGSIELSSIPLSINESDPDGIENNNLLGNNLLKRFNTIIDLKNFQIYFRTNSLLNSEF